MAESPVSPLVVNRLSVYLRCLQELQARQVERISSTELAERFHLSAAQIRKDLAQFGEFGIRGVGYEVGELIQRLREVLGLEAQYGIVIVGVGALGTALARSPGFNSQGFRVVALVDSDPEKVGREIDHHVIRPVEELAAVVRANRARLGVLTVPPAAAQSTYDALAAAGVRAVLNFAPVQIRVDPRSRLKQVDLRIFLEELAFFLQA